MNVFIENIKIERLEFHNVTTINDAIFSKVSFNEHHGRKI